MKRIILGIISVFLLTAVVIVVRTFAVGSAPTVDGDIANIQNAYDKTIMGERLGKAIRFPTISQSLNAPVESDAFAGLRDFLEQTYPAAHAAMAREIVKGNSLMFKWEGAGGEKPIALLAHMDVVPVEAGTEDEWEHPPFSGVIHDGAVWGRGALDDKGQVIALMEAAEQLAASGFQPTRDVYFLFGHDEEIGGGNGAGAIADTLRQRGVHFAWTLDEGSGLVQGIIPGVAGPVALISTAEKGSTTLRLTARGQGGHSSTPADDTAVSILSRAIVAITDELYPLELDDNVVSFLHAIAPELPFAQRMALANLWLSAPIIKAQLSEDAVTAASMRTTTAPTIVEGGTKTNILPQQASAYVNYRIHPRDDVESVKARAIRLINDERVSIVAVGGREPSPQASTSADGYLAIEAATAAIFGDIPIAPFLTLQGTDTVHFTTLADDNYRFTPFIYESEDLQRIHGTDEHARLDDLARAAAWYEDLIRRSAGPEGE